MLRFFFLILNFLIIEIKLYKKKFQFLKKFIEEISLFNLLINLLFNEKKSLFKDPNLNFFLKYNPELWKLNSVTEDKIILIDLTLNRQPIHAICQCILANNLKKINNYECKAIIKEYDFLTKFIAKSFLIRSFIVIKNGNFFQRLNYYLKAINVIPEENLENNLIKYKYNNIEIGKAAYEFAIRNYFKDLPEKKKNYLFYLSLSKSLQIYDQVNIILKEKNIKIFVMAEIQFLPHRIFFQISQKRNIKVFSFFGAQNSNAISVTCFNDFKKKNMHRMKFSKKLFFFLNKNFKFQLNRNIKNFIRKQMYNFQLGFGEKKFQKILSKKKLLVFNNKKDFYDKYKLDYKLKNILILPNVFVDNILTHDWGLYSTPLEWYKDTLKKITNIKSVNWIIKPHPSERFYNTNITAKTIYESIIRKNDNIRIINENENISKLSEYVSSVISFGGSAGYEYTYFGIPVITVCETRYSNFNITISPKNMTQYNEILEKIDKLKKVSKNDKFNAGLYWYLIRHLTQIKHSLIPIFDNKKIANKLFWKKQKIKLIKDNKYVDKLFLSNLKTQYLKQNRHCLNVQLLNKNKFIDLSLNDLKLN